MPRRGIKSFGPTISVPWGFTESSLELSPGISASTEQSEVRAEFSQLQFAMSAIQGITRYSGGGGSTQKTFIHEVRAAYERMKNSSAEHELNGFGEMEFIKLLSSKLDEESKDVLSAFLDDWDHDNEDNKNHRAAENAETGRILWRAYQCDRTAWKKLRKNSGFESEPGRPDGDEPRDLERFLEVLTSRFKSSTTENLNLLTRFKIEKDDTPERLFARFNLIVKPLEDERPRVMTTDNLKTTYMHHVKQILSIA